MIHDPIDQPATAMARSLAAIAPRIGDRAAVRWWEVFGTLRWGAMCAGFATAFRTTDPSPERAMIARRTSETEIDLLRLIGA